MQSLIETILTVCPAIRRIGYILGWLYEIIRDQVNPTRSALSTPPSLWPGWDWGWMNAYHSHRERPWEPYRYRGTVEPEDEF